MSSPPRGGTLNSSQSVCIHLWALYSVDFRLWSGRQNNGALPSDLAQPQEKHSQSQAGINDGRLFLFRSAGYITLQGQVPRLQCCPFSFSPRLFPLPAINKQIAQGKTEQNKLFLPLSTYHNFHLTPTLLSNSLISVFPSPSSGKSPSPSFPFQ